MSARLSWLPRVSLCAALLLSPMLVSPAFADAQRNLSQRAASAQTAEPNARDLQCLTEALYFEARGEGAQGQRAVAEVIMNRVDHPNFPKSVCGVVNQRGQFTYRRTAIREKGVYYRVQQVAKAALAGSPRNLTNGATYFHTPAVRPSWSRRFERTTRIGSHIFYRSDRRLAVN